MSIELTPLPFPSDALEPHLSARALQTHHGKHHRAYVDRANALLDNSRESLEEIILHAAKHPFYWRSLRPKSAAAPSQFTRFVEPLKSAAKNHFAAAGRGWSATQASSRS